MKITAIEPVHLRVPVVEAIPDGTLDVLIVRIHTDAGITGVGEVTSQSYVCKACFEAPRSASRRHGLTSILLGENPLEVERLWEKMYFETNRYGRRGAAIHAISGADIALWDIRGQAEGKPVCELLGGAHRDTVRAYASVLFGETPEATAGLARDFVDLGLTAAKFGWGPFGQDAATDREHVQAAREVLGGHRDLMVDAGHAWQAETGVRVALPALARPHRRRGRRRDSF
jgi:L-rhamnonate dehydratase